MKILDLSNWNRKEHFDFFNSFDEPYFGIVATVDCSNAFTNSQQQGISFFAYYLYCSMLAVNNVPEFKYRIDNDKIIIHDIINASPTIGRKDGTFGFGYVPFNDDFTVFRNNVANEVERVQLMRGIGLNNDTIRTDVIHYSSIPWYSFSGLTHPRNFIDRDSVPKITFGKVHKDNDGRHKLPVSVTVHHGLCDGLHVGKYLDEFENNLRKDHL